MAIRKGSNNPLKKMYIGNNEVVRIYLGDTLAYGEEYVPIIDRSYTINKVFNPSTGEMEILSTPITIPDLLEAYNETVDGITVNYQGLMTQQTPYYDISYTGASTTGLIGKMVNGLGSRTTLNVNPTTDDNNAIITTRIFPEESGIFITFPEGTEGSTMIMNLGLGCRPAATAATTSSIRLSVLNSNLEDISQEVDGYNRNGVLKMSNNGYEGAETSLSFKVPNDRQIKLKLEIDRTQEEVIDSVLTNQISNFRYGHIYLTKLERFEGVLQYINAITPDGQIIIMSCGTSSTEASIGKVILNTDETVTEGIYPSTGLHTPNNYTDGRGLYSGEGIYLTPFDSTQPASLEGFLSSMSGNACIYDSTTYATNHPLVSFLSSTEITNITPTNFFEKVGFVEFPYSLGQVVMTTASALTSWGGTQRESIGVVFGKYDNNGRFIPILSNLTTAYAPSATQYCVINESNIDDYAVNSFYSNNLNGYVYSLYNNANNQSGPIDYKTMSNTSIQSVAGMENARAYGRLIQIYNNSGTYKLSYTTPYDLQYRNIYNSNIAEITHVRILNTRQVDYMAHSTYSRIVNVSGELNITSSTMFNGLDFSDMSDYQDTSLYPFMD